MIDRYSNIFKCLGERLALKPETIRILEVGTYDGARAEQMITYCTSSAQRDIHVVYHGFDLFEDMTKEMTAAELSKSKLPPSIDDVMTRLSGLPNSSVGLSRGNTRETLAEYTKSRLHHGAVDFIWMDGGHSVQTIESDFFHCLKLLAPKGILLLDDYYHNRGDFGCRMLIEALPQLYPHVRAEILPPMDHYEHTGLDISTVKVTWK